MNACDGLHMLELLCASVGLARVLLWRARRVTILVSDEQQPLIAASDLNTNISASPSRLASVSCLLLLLLKLSILIWPLVISKTVSTIELVAWTIALALFIIGKPFESMPEVPPSVQYALLFYCVSLVSETALLFLSMEVSQIEPLAFVNIAVTLLSLAVTGYQHSHLDDQIERQKEDILKSSSMIPPTRLAKASAISVLLFSWMNPLMRLGNSRPLVLADVPDLAESDKANAVIAAFESNRLNSNSLGLVLLWSERRAFLFQFSGGMISALLSLAGPLILYELTGYLNDPKNRPPSFALVCVLLLGFFMLLKAIIDAHSWQSGRRMGMRLKVVLAHQIFRKSLQKASSNNAELKADEAGDDSVGKIVTLVSSDAEKVKDSFPKLQDLIIYPFRILLATTALFFVVGWPAIASLVVMLAIWPIIYVISRWQDRVFGRLLAATDKRTDIVNEALQGIRIIKCFAWEARFLRKIEDARRLEMRGLIDYYLQDAVGTLVWLMSPVLVSFCTLFAITAIAGIDLDAQMAFTCLSLFNTLRIPLSLMPDVLVELLQLNVSVDRISKFLSQEELEKYTGQRSELPDEAPTSASSERVVQKAELAIREGTFRYYTAGDSPYSLSFPALKSDGTESNFQPPFTLRDITVKFPIGKLSAVCGQTGAGKSSLILALLGELERVSGTVTAPDPRNARLLNNGLTSGVAFVTQQSWLQNDTIRDNITFGEPYDFTRYDAVIKACSLVKDFASFESGDLTEIGEKGINLSGGQKQRISLARAAYSRASIILLDDPLSACDAPTSRIIFNRAILALLGGRTRILVTHATSLVLPESDYIVVMNRGGIVAAGDLDTISHCEPAAAILDVDFVEPDDEESERSSTAGTIHDANALLTDYANGKSRNDATRLVEDESVQTGAVKSSVYWSFICASGGVAFIFSILAIMIFDRAIMVYGDFWVKTWAESYEHDFFGENPARMWRLGAAWFWSWTEYDRTLTGRFLALMYGPSFISQTEPTLKISGVDTMYYISVYAAICFLWVFVFVLADSIKSFGSYWSSTRYHNSLMNRIFGAPLSYFQVTPTGRILNRATKDISIIDKNVMNGIEGFTSRVLDGIFVIVVVSAITPAFLAAVLPIIVVYVAVSRRYLSVSRELKRLESITRSPIYSMLSETLYGVTTIRAFGAEDRFSDENLLRIDINHRAYFYLWASNRWLSIRISAIAATIIILAGVALIITRGLIDPSLAALSLTWALTISDSLIWIVRFQAEMEMNMNAVERVDEYLGIEQERPAILPDSRPPPDWPSRGTLVISRLEMRYSPSQPPVLRNISVSIAGGLKVGIVGRTGAGKSSLALSLFRIVEPTHGSIVIDGVDISAIGLYDLRSRLTLVPQDPVLFTGTVRTNLDPFSEHDDAVLWESLRDVGLIRDVELLRESSEETLVGESAGNPVFTVKLDTAVTEAGGNFSQGQRQLLCLARALIKNTKITVFDEATASVDHDTDYRIQQTLRGSKFAHTTTLTIAHRLRTVADYDQILVLERGELAEVGTPYDLMNDPGSLFREMCVESGEFEELLGMATARKR